MLFGRARRALGGHRDHGGDRRQRRSGGARDRRGRLDERPAGAPKTGLGGHRHGRRRSLAARAAGRAGRRCARRARAARARQAPAVIPYPSARPPWLGRALVLVRVRARAGGRRARARTRARAQRAAPIELPARAADEGRSAGARGRAGAARAAADRAPGRPVDARDRPRRAAHDARPPGPAALGGDSGAARARLRPAGRHHAPRHQRAAPRRGRLVGGRSAARRARPRGPDRPPRLARGPRRVRPRARAAAGSADHGRRRAGARTASAWSASWRCQKARFPSGAVYGAAAGRCWC